MSECEKICKDFDSGCRKELRKQLEAERQSFEADLKIAKDYCKAVDNKDEAGQCKDEVKDRKDDEKADLKQGQREIQEQCAGDRLRQNCEITCLEGGEAAACEDLFFSDIRD